MPLDPRIILGAKSVELDNPLAQYAQMLQAQGLQQQNALGQAKLGEYQNSLARDNDLRGILASAPADAPGALLKGGFMKESQDLQKTNAEVADKTATTAGKNLDNRKKQLEHGILTLQTAQTPQDAYAQIDAEVAAGRLTAEDSAKGKAAIPTDQAQFEQWRPMQLKAITDAYRQLPTVQTRNTGGSTDTLAIDPFTGKAMVTGSVRNTQDPNSVASNARMVSEGALNRNQSERASLRADARMRANDAAGPGTDRPLSRAAFTQITEARDNAATIDRLKASFKPEYAEKGVLGVGSELSMRAKGVLGTDKESVEWWKNYRKQAELIERHALFGATLTGNELSAWRSADIDPGMDSAVIEKNLATRAMIAKKVFDNKQQDLIDAGSSEGRIRAIGGRNTDVSDSTNAPSAKAGGLTAAEQAELAQLRKQLRR